MNSTPQGPLDDAGRLDEPDAGAGSSHGTGEGKSAIEEPGMGGTDYIEDGVLPDPDNDTDTGTGTTGIGTTG